MATTARRTPAKRAGKSRKYEKDPRKKIEAGQPWTMHFDLENDVALKLLDEKERTGADYSRLLNQRIRKGYGLPAVK
jgi:hypothetical protein